MQKRQFGARGRARLKPTQLVRSKPLAQRGLQTKAASFHLQGSVLSFSLSPETRANTALGVVRLANSRSDVMQSSASNEVLKVREAGQSRTLVPRDSSRVVQARVAVKARGPVEAEAIVQAARNAAQEDLSPVRDTLTGDSAPAREIVEDPAGAAQAQDVVAPAQAVEGTIGDRNTVEAAAICRLRGEAGKTVGKTTALLALELSSKAREGRETIVRSKDQVEPQEPSRKRQKCTHGREKNRCKECGGSSLCPHGRQKCYCKDCGGSQICSHGRHKSRCKECGGSAICTHGRQRSSCKECGGCVHNKLKSRCKECGGSSICPHGRRKSQCKECGGSSICAHGRQKNSCKECGGSSICPHGRQKSKCKDCGGASICGHGRQKHTCKECGGSSICTHRRQRSQCKECGGSSICAHSRQRSSCKECGGCVHNKKSQCKECADSSAEVLN